MAPTMQKSVVQSQTAHQQQQQQQQQLPPQKPGGGGSGGGDDPRGSGIPMPPDRDGGMGEFMAYVVKLMDYWVATIDSNQDLLGQNPPETREPIVRAWGDYQQNWAQFGDHVRFEADNLGVEQLKMRGLAGVMLELKYQRIRDQIDRLRIAIRDQLKIRKAWRKLFEAVDVVLDSVGAALAPIGVAGAMASGLKELKEVAMGVCDDVDD